jgi:hypothetical protein
LAKIIAANKGISKTEEHKLTVSLSMPNSVKIEVLDKETNVTSTFPSITKAAEALGVTKQALSKRFSGTTNSFVFKHRYRIEKIKKNTQD